MDDLPLSVRIQVVLTAADPPKAYYGRRIPVGRRHGHVEKQLLGLPTSLGWLSRFAHHRGQFESLAAAPAIARPLRVVFLGAASQGALSLERSTHPGDFWFDRCPWVANKNSCPSTYKGGGKAGS